MFCRAEFGRRLMPLLDGSRSCEGHVASWSTGPVPNQSSVSLRAPVSLRQPIARSAKEKVSPNVLRDAAHQNPEIGEGTRGYGGHGGSGCRCVEGRFGQGEASREGSSIVDSDCS